MAKVPVKVLIVKADDGVVLGHDYIYLDDRDNTKTTDEYPKVFIGEKFPEKLPHIL